MNKRYENINKILDTHVAGALLSKKGRNMYFPTGIVWQAEQSATAKIKATAGMAFEKGSPIALKSMQKLFPSLTPKDVVAYAPVAGIPELRTLWKEHIKETNPSIAIKNITLPITTCGLTHGISTLLSCMLEKNQALITPDMYWENYSHMVETFIGGKIKTFPMFSSLTSLPKFNTAGLKTVMKKVASQYKKVVLLLNFPNNPTGYSCTTDVVKEIKQSVLSIAEKNIPVLILCDDAYFGLFYEENVYKESLFSIFSRLHKKVLAVKIDGATKELLSWGLRVGFITFGCKEFPQNVKNALEEKIKGFLRASTTSSPRISQTLVINALASKTLSKNIHTIFLSMKRKYEATKQAIKIAEKKYPKSGLQPYPFNSGYFVSFKCNKAHQETIRKSLLKKESIALIALDNALRFTFSVIEAPLIPTIIELLYKEAQLLQNK